MSTEKTTQAPVATAKPGIDYREAENIAHEYANNVQVLSSNWDLELIFGELNQKLGPNVVVQHTSIKLPWTQAKALLFFLNLHLMGHEAEFGRAVIPKGIIPEIPAQKPKEAAAAPDEVYQKIRKYYEDFIKANPEASPSK